MNPEQMRRRENPPANPAVLAVVIGLMVGCLAAIRGAVAVGPVTTLWITLSMFASAIGGFLLGHAWASHRLRTDWEAVARELGEELPIHMFEQAVAMHTVPRAP